MESYNDFVIKFESGMTIMEIVAFSPENLWKRQNRLEKTQ